ncbi:hypothetical protein AGMMS50248_00440 [Deltaproteobacteria bacterium]|nr:hypothetical protein AGMMS50248_00440 [Deltaproteobacteria bacterium]
MAGNVAENVLAGRFTPVTGEAFMELWQKRDKNKVFFIDSRPAAGRAVEASHPDWHSIPLEETCGQNCGSAAGPACGAYMQYRAARV